MSKQLKNRSFHPPQGHVINSTNIFHQQNTELSTYATKSTSIINKTSLLTKNYPSNIYQLIKT